MLKCPQMLNLFIVFILWQCDIIINKILGCILLIFQNFPKFTCLFITWKSFGINDRTSMCSNLIFSCFYVDRWLVFQWISIIYIWPPHAKNCTNFPMETNAFGFHIDFIFQSNNVLFKLGFILQHWYIATSILASLGKYMVVSAWQFWIDLG